MNEQSKNDFVKFWLNVASYYRQNIPDETIKLYVYDCREFAIEEIRTAFEKHRTSAKAEFFPVPAVLKNLARPPIDDEAEAHAAVARIQACLSPFKSAQDAREYMGELAWEVVKAMGGWRWFGENPPPNSFVQRDMFEKAKAFLIRARQGRTDVAPSLGYTDRPQIASQTTDSSNSGASSVARLVSDALKGKSLN